MRVLVCVLGVVVGLGCGCIEGCVSKGADNEWVGMVCTLGEVFIYCNALTFILIIIFIHTCN